jgi:DNA-binding response OmpR family regulator
MTEHALPTEGTVLLIEDNKELVNLITESLTAARYRVVVAPSARHAFTNIFKSPPDIVILDINLPDLDGFHVAKELKRNMMLRHIPVILLTSRIDFLDKMRSLDVIVDEYLVKPIDVKDLLLRTQLVIR